MANSLPMTLRVYQRLSAAVVPLAPALIKRRLKQGKEDPARIGERRGVSQDVRPHGPLVWIHGASVGEVLAAAALIEKLRALNIRILLTSGTVTSAAIVAKRFPADIIHQYVPYDSPRYVARFLDHWRPSLALFIESDLWPNLILSSAARRLPMVLINGRMSHRSFPRWRRVTGTISALLGRFDVCLAQSQVDAERFAALGSRNVITTGNLKLDVPAPPADAARLERLMSVTRGRPIIVAASTHPGEEEILVDAHRALAGFFPVAAERDRAAASRSRRGHRPHHRRFRPARRPCARARNCRRRRPISMSPTPWANWACSTGWRRSCSWADRWSSMAGRIRSRRSSSAPSIVHGPARLQFHRRLRGARRRRRRAAGRHAGSAGEAARPVAGRSRGARMLGRAPRRAWSSSSAARSIARWPRWSRICCSCGSRWERRMREPAFWYRPPSLTSRLLAPLGAVYGVVAAQRMQREGFDAGIPVICVGNYHVGGAGKTPDGAGADQTAARARRDAGRAQPRLWRTIARAGHGRSRAARRGRCRRRAADAGADGAGRGRARSHRRRRAGAFAGRHA